MNSDDQGALDAAGLGGRPAFTHDIDGETALLVDVTTAEMLDAWGTARAAVGRTGRWPVLAMRSQAHDGFLFSRFYFNEGSHRADSSPAAVLARAELIDVDARLFEQRTQYPDGLVDWIAPEIERAREETRVRYGDAPAAAEIRSQIRGPERVELCIEQALFDWETGRECRAEPVVGVQDWYGWDEDAVTLVLLPSPQPWAVYAYVDALYDACGYGHDLLVAAARRWYERYGAEPVAALDVMTWLTVSRPPTQPRDAWDLAVEHHALAESTFSSPGVAVRQHAHQLPDMDRWVLFSRP